MPVYLRNFYLRELSMIKDDERAQIEKATKKQTKIHRPNIGSNFKP